MTGILDSTGPAERLLCALVASTLTTSHALAPDGREVDWTRFARLVDRHRVSPLIWRARETLASVGAPDEVLRSVAASNARNGLRSLNAASLLVRLLQALSAGGVSAIPLKGISLAARAYGDVAGRHCGDIDLLIPAGDLPAADTILRETGWRRVSNTTREQVGEDYAEDPALAHHFSYTQGGAALELHFSLHPNPELMPIDIEGVIGQGASVEIGGVRVPVLPDDWQLQFLCTHGARHNWKRLQWIADIAVLLDRATPEQQRLWMAAARRKSLMNPVMQGIRLAEITLGMPRPAGAPEGEGSFALRTMVSRAARTVFRSVEEEPDEVAAGLDPGIRFYRMCMTGRLAYQWQEVRRGVHSLATHLSGGARA